MHHSHRVFKEHPPPVYYICYELQPSVTAVQSPLFLLFFSFLFFRRHGLIYNEYIP